MKSVLAALSLVAMTSAPVLAQSGSRIVWCRVNIHTNHVYTCYNYQRTCEAGKPSNYMCMAFQK